MKKSEDKKCAHGMPMFQSCDECNREMVKPPKIPLYTQEQIDMKVKEERIKFWNELRQMLYKKYGYKEFLLSVEELNKND